MSILAFFVANIDFLNYIRLLLKKNIIKTNIADTILIIMKWYLRAINHTTYKVSAKNSINLAPRREAF